MQAYLYDETTFLYTGQIAATPGDVPGSYIYPLNALTAAPSTDEPGRWKARGFEWVEVSPDELLQIKQAAIVVAVQARLDAFAQTRGYDGILSATSYETSTDPQFALEGRHAKEARDATWAKCYAIQNAYLAKPTDPEPTLEDILNQLPVLAWPEA